MAMRIKVLDPGAMLESQHSITLHCGTHGFLYNRCELQVFVRDPHNKDPRTAFDEQTGEHGYWEAVPVVR